MDLHRQRLNPYAQVNPPPESVERFPQWTHDETRELLAIRAQLDRSFTETKRNKPLWEATSSMLQQKGFFRTPDQCKSKWKNLVTRFKGIESAEGEIGKQFPFYEEMRRIFADRMERLLVFEKDKGKGVQVRVKEWEEEAEEEEEEEEEEGKAEESLSSFCRCFAYHQGLVSVAPAKVTEACKCFFWLLPLCHLLFRLSLASSPI
uniref:Myb-like domain-containing protein n=1 Tax=Musa acuminata subsp. malaccensis TaxID=214687 RepID=A0A804K9C9_MUSAM